LGRLFFSFFVLHVENFFFLVFVLRDGAQLGIFFGNWHRRRKKKKERQTKSYKKRESKEKQTKQTTELIKQKNKTRQNKTKQNKTN
jgi:hypothetical protein